MCHECHELNMDQVNSRSRAQKMSLMVTNLTFIEYIYSKKIVKARLRNT